MEEDVFVFFPVSVWHDNGEMFSQILYSYLDFWYNCKDIYFEEHMRGSDHEYTWGIYHFNSCEKPWNLFKLQNNKNGDKIIEVY